MVEACKSHSVLHQSNDTTNANVCRGSVDARKLTIDAEARAQLRHARGHGKLTKDASAGDVLNGVSASGSGVMCCHVLASL